MRFDRKPGDVDTCIRCGEHELSHEWHCSKCGIQSTKIGKCGYDAVYMPEPACECQAGIGLWCPAAKRRITSAQYAEILRVKNLAKSIGAKFSGPGYAWDDAEVERLWKEQAS